MTEPTLAEAARAVAVVDDVVATAIDTTRPRGAEAHDDQVSLYRLAHMAAAASMCGTAVRYGDRGAEETRVALVFVGRAIADVGAAVWSTHDRWGLAPDALAGIQPFVVAATDGEFVAAGADATGAAHLDADLELVAETFRRFAADRIAPRAEAIHRGDLDVPEEIITGVAELGCFGLSVPAKYGGSAQGTPDDHVAMVIATEELSRASLAAGGSLITRPEILARAIEAGGTEEQKSRWLPPIASGEMLAAVAVTEPDHGSDVAAITTSATRVEGGWVLNGTKTWCTFAGRATALMVLARTNPDPDVGHRGLSIFVVDKPAYAGHAFRHETGGGVLEGRAIPTMGYRGMHSFEVVFDDWFVPADDLVGGPDGVGRGFYLQMAGFENGRIQTAARAVGLMQRAYELARDYAAHREVFGQPLDAYQLTRAKLAAMAATTQIGRQYTYEAARGLATGDGALRAAMAKAHLCRAVEWVTREAQQLHGGFGYAEEYEISRLFVDARVLSIFEGADETLCLKLIARRLLA